MQIRHESNSDIKTVDRIQYAAFKDHPLHEIGAEPVEHAIVETLRASGELALSLVAERNGESVGHIAFSAATVGGSNGWFLLGPIGVLPAHQRVGVGSALVREAIDILKGRGASGIVLVGDPAYYRRFGFASRGGLTYPGVPGSFVLALPFGGNPEGEVGVHRAFQVG